MRKSHSNQNAYVYPSPLRPHTGLLRIGLWTCRLSLGRHGVTFRKKEGDGATPVTDLRLTRLFLRPDQGCLFYPPALPTQIIKPQHGWCDDVLHPRYNQLINRPFHASHEEMWRSDALYNLVLDTNWNKKPCIKGRGSAIFIHVQRADQGPTAGCLAFQAPLLLRLLKRIPRLNCFRIQPASRKPIKKLPRL